MVPSEHMDMSDRLSRDVDLEFSFSSSLSSFCILFVGDVASWFFSRALLAAFLPIATLRPAGVVARRRSSNEGGWPVIVWRVRGWGDRISAGAVSTGEVGLWHDG